MHNYSDCSGAIHTHDDVPDARGCEHPELPRLETFLERGTANGLKGLRLLSAAEALEIEPHVRCLQAVHVLDCPCSCSGD